MDLKPVRRQDLWWCERVGVHLPQTHEKCVREAGAFKSQLSQRIGKREDTETIQSLPMKNYKRFSNCEGRDSSLTKWKVLQTEPFASCTAEELRLKRSSFLRGGIFIHGTSQELLNLLIGYNIVFEKAFTHTLNIIKGGI